MELGAEAARNAVQEGSDFTLYVCRGSQVEKEAIFLFYEPASSPSSLGAIHWCPRGTREVIPENCLQLNQLTDILITKQTAVFQSPEASEAIDNHCFSVLTKDNALDLEASSRQLLETWTFGIETLMASRCVTKVKHGEADDLVALPLCTPSKSPVSALVSTPVPAISTPVPVVLSTPGPLSVPPLVPVDAEMPFPAISFLEPESLPVVSSPTPASQPILTLTPTLIPTDVPTEAAPNSPKDEDPFSAFDLKPSTYVMATPMRIPGAPSPLNNLRIRSHLRPTLAQTRDGSLLGEFRSADEVFKGGNETENSTEAHHRPRESVTRLSMVNFLALKERRVQELQTKIERLTGSLNSPVPKQLLSARAGSRAQQRVGGMHLTNKELKELISDMKRDTEYDLKSMQEHMEYTVMAMSTAFNIQRKRNAELEENLRLETKRRKAAVEKVLDLQGSIRVFCRVRPLNPRELSEGDHAIIKVDQEDSMVMSVGGETKRFNYDHVFGPQSTQEQVFLEVSPLVDSCISGYTVCIFAYGQTGSGKTHTMEGPKHDRGVNYRALQYLFDTCAEERKQNPALSYQVNVSVVEIYMEEVRDLLSGPGVRVDIREGAEGVYIPGLEERVVTSAEEVQDLMLHEAYPNRQVRGTSMNDKSSRSHCLVFVRCAATNASTGVKTLGTLILIDLAGSERLKKSEAVGDAMKEAQAINKSLSALGNVIASLQQKNAHVPFRDSKLTFLLQNSLGGSCKCLMFCQIGPAASNHQETSCSLTFANRVRSTKLGQAKRNFSEAKVSEPPRSPISHKLKDQVKSMEQTLKSKTDGMTALEMRIRELEQENAALRETGHVEKPKEKSRLDRTLQPTRTNEVRREAFISSIHSETTRLDAKKKAAPVSTLRATRTTLREVKPAPTKKEPDSPAKDGSPLNRKRKGDEPENKENEAEVNQVPKPASRSKSLSHVHKKPKQRAKKTAAATLVPGTMGRSKRFAF